jgi:archaellum component FlaC
MFVSVVRVHGQTDDIMAEILPVQGPANTTILIRFTSLNPNVSNVQTADVFWDNYTIGLNQQFVPGANGISQNYNVTPPAFPPFSDLGNHTIRVDTSIVPFGPQTFLFTFNITTPVPSQDFLILNSTYYQLLANFADISGNFTQLQTSFDELSANYTELQQEHNNDTLNYNTLLAQYNVLYSDFNSLTANFNLISNNYANLNSTYDTLSSSYASLQASLQTLASNYVALNSSYTNLISNYNSVTAQLDQSRNINIILVIATIALLVITVYFAFLKTRTPVRQR